MTWNFLGPGYRFPFDLRSHLQRFVQVVLYVYYEQYDDFQTFQPARTTAM